jgi:hypothetical protein
MAASITSGVTQMLAEKLRSMPVIGALLLALATPTAGLSAGTHEVVPEYWVHCVAGRCTEYELRFFEWLPGWLPVATMHGECSGAYADLTGTFDYGYTGYEDIPRDACQWYPAGDN